MEKDTSSVNPVRRGRPSIKVDYAMLLSMHDVEHLGWARMADKHQELTGQFISRDTVRRGYNVGKALQIIMGEKFNLIYPHLTEKPQLVYKRVTPNPDTVEINGQIWVKVKKNRNL